MKKNIAVVICLFSFLSGLFASEQDESISVNYIDAAWKELSRNNWEKAGEYLNSASQFYTGFSDYWYIGSLIEEHRNHIDKSLNSIDRAINLDEWKIFSLREALIVKSGILFRLRRYGDQIELYDVTYPLYKTDPELLKLTCEAAYRGAFIDKARNLVDFGKSRYPDNAYFYYMDLLIDNNAENFSSLLFVCRKNDESPLPYLEDYIYIKRKKSLKVVTDYYRTAHQPADETDRVALFESGIYLFEDTESITEKIRDLEALDLFYKTLKDGKEREYFFSGLNGQYILDWNRDKICEEKSVWRNGILLSWSIDKDQNGKEDIELFFDDKGNVRLCKMPAIDICYSEYPRVDCIKIYRDLDIDTVFYFDFGEYIVNIIDWNGKETLIPDFLYSRIEEEKLLENCLKAADFYKDRMIRSYTVENKRITGIEEDTDLDNTIDHKMIIENGQIKSGLRDIDGNGIFDVYEYYKKGRWTGFAYDSDGDNNPEYYEDWAILHLKLWDIDQDAIIDILSYTDYEQNINKKDSLLFPLLLNKDDFLTWDFTYERHWFR